MAITAACAQEEKQLQTCLLQPDVNATIRKYFAGAYPGSKYNIANGAVKIVSCYFMLQIKDNFAGYHSVAPCCQLTHEIMDVRQCCPWCVQNKTVCTGTAADDTELPERLV